VKRQRDTVDNVSVHAVENLAGSLEGIDDSRETGGQENDIGGRAGSIGSTFDSNTSIGLLQGGGIVDTVTSHSNQVTTLLENLDDVVLVLGENLGETIGSLNEIVNLGTGHVTTTRKTKLLSVVDIGSKSELARSLTSNTNGITSQHLDGKTKALGFVNSLGGIVTRRVGARHNTENLPVAFTTLASNTEGTEPTSSKLSDLVLIVVGNVFRNGMVLLDGAKNEKRGTLNTDNAFTLGRLDDSGDLLGNGIEGEELEDLVAGEDILGAGVESEGLQESLVDSVETLLLAGSSQTSSKHKVIRLDTLDGVWLSERELVLGKGTGLVGAENLDTSKGLDGRELLDNGLLLSKVGSTDSHGGSNDSGKTDGDTDDGNSESELKDFDNVVRAVERCDPDDEKSEDDKDEQHCTDTVQDLGEMTSSGRSLVDQSSGATDESVITSRSDDHEGLTTLDGRGSVTVVTFVLIDSEGLSSDSGLIDLQEGIIGNNATVGRNNSTFFDLEDVTGNDLRGLDFRKATVTENDSFEGESLLQFVDDRSGLELLDETDTGVEHQKSTDNTEINPILKTGSKNGSSLDDQLIKKCVENRRKKAIVGN